MSRTMWHGSGAYGTRSLSEWTVVALAGLAFAVSRGLNYGISNHNPYLLRALRLVNPELLAQDWFTTQTTDYHGSFSLLASLMLRIDASGWLFAVANVLAILGIAVVLFLLIGRVTEHPHRIPVFLLVLSFSFATDTLTAVHSRLVLVDFEPATIGVAGFLLACYLFVRKSHGWSGLALAVGGLFHANYLWLGFPVFLVAHLLLGRDRLASRLVRQFAAPALALIPFLPIMISAVVAPESADASWIYTNIRAPHHYVPSTYWPRFLSLAGWLLLWVVTVPRKDLGARRLSAATVLVLSLTIPIIFGTLLTTVVYLPSVARVYVWRLCPIVILLAQVFVARALAGFVNGDQYDGVVRSELQRIVWVGISFCLLIAHYVYLEPNRSVKILTVVIVLSMTLGWVLRMSPLRRPSRLARLSVVIALLAFLSVGVGSLTKLDQRSNLLRSPEPNQESLYSWAHTTDLDAVFIVPPQFEDFRLRSERAIVVDWKSVPAMPDEIDEWYTRMTAVSGGNAPLSQEEAAQGYDRLEKDQLAALASRFAVDYMIRERRSAWEAPPEWSIVFSNEQYEALQVTH